MERLVRVAGTAQSRGFLLLQVSDDSVAVFHQRRFMAIFALAMAPVYICIRGVVI